MEEQTRFPHRMKMPVWAGVFLLLTGMRCGAPPNPDAPQTVSQDRYLGFDPPDGEGRIFAPNLISSGEDEHSAPAIAPDGSEIYWSMYNESDQRMEIKTLTREGDTWSPPVTAAFSGVFWDDSPVFSPDGSKLFFCSKRPHGTEDAPRKDQDIWMMRRQNGEWGKPERLSFNTELGESWCSAAANGNLYFSAVYYDSIGKGDIYIAKYVDGAYSKPVNMGEPVNSRSHEVTPYIAPDESYLIFASTERYLGDGLYLSFKRPNGSWTEPVLINNLLTPVSFKRYPGVSPDGRFLFYVGRAKTNAHRDIYWVEAGIIEEFKSRANLQ